MLRVLIILLCVLGGVVLLLALALLVLLNIRARLEFVGVSGDMTLDAVYGPVRVPLWPRPRHLKRKKNRKEDETGQKGEEEPAGGRFSLAKGGLPFGEIADILLGQTAALCGILVPFLENTFDLRDIHVRADPDFEKDKTEWAAEVFCAIRPITFIRIAFRHRKPLRRLYELLKQGVKA